MTNKKSLVKNGQAKKRPSVATGKSGGPNVSSLAKRLDQLMQRIPRGAFAAAGGALGGPTGALIGKGISNISGYGDYAVTSNTVSRNGMHGGVEVPSFSNRSVRITHREYFADVVVPADAIGFKCTKYDLSPTNPLIVPWLSKITAKFAKYKVHGLVFYYKPMSTDYNNSGTVAMTVNYDPAEMAFESMQGILNSKFAVSCKPSVAMVAPVECDPSTLTGGGVMLVDHPGLGVLNEPRFTSMGALNVATQGCTMPSGSVLGQLHVTIDLELINPFLHRRQYTDSTPKIYRVENFGEYPNYVRTTEKYAIQRGKQPVNAAYDHRYVRLTFDGPGTYFIVRSFYNGTAAGTAEVKFESANTNTSPFGTVSNIFYTQDGPFSTSMMFKLTVTAPCFITLNQNAASVTGSTSEQLAVVEY
jgi:hypothetical protein